MRIADILEAAESIASYTRAMSLDEFRRDSRTMDAVVRNLEIIGEASRRIPESVREEQAEVPWSDMADMRNLLIHEYFGVDPEILWRTVQTDLPLIVPILRDLAKKP